MSDLVVVARNPLEMAQAQDSLLQWAEGKIGKCELELMSIRQNMAVARERKWRLQGWRNQERMARLRLQCFQKVRAAIKAGYCLVPNFPVDVIAIRTSAERPNDPNTTRWRGEVAHHQQTPEPIGVGRYVSPNPTARGVVAYRKNSEGENVPEQRYTADEFQGLDLPPFAFVRPEVVTSIEKALSLNIFDRIGILPGRRRRGDPIVVGQIVRKSQGYSRLETNDDVLTFLIAWWIDTEDL